MALVSAAEIMEVRGAMAGTVNGESNLVDNSFTWNPQNFAGSFYDTKRDLGTETFKFVLTDGNKLSGDKPLRRYLHNHCPKEGLPAQALGILQDHWLWR